MNLLYIDDKELLGTMMNYLEGHYTTDLEEEYDTVVFASISPSTKKFIEKEKLKKKRIVFITYLEESKIYIQSKLKNKSSESYMKKIYTILKLSDLVITSLPYFRTLLESNDKEKIVVIEKELSILNISKTTNDIFKRNHLNRRKKRFLIFDLDYHFLSYVRDIALKYPKSEILYVGYRKTYLLSSRDKKIVKELPKNIKCIFHFDIQIITDLIQISDMIINFEDINLDRNYLYAILLLKKELMIRHVSLFEDYFINSKNVYTFKTKDGLLKKLEKIEYDRLANLTDNAYDLVKQCTPEKIKEKFIKNLEN
jgi:hypothetical protein